MAITLYYKQYELTHLAKMFRFSREKAVVPGRAPAALIGEGAQRFPGRLRHKTTFRNNQGREGGEHDKNDNLCVRKIGRLGSFTSC